MRRRLVDDEQGATAIEYALIAAGIGVAIVADRMALGSVDQRLYCRACAALFSIARSAARLLAGRNLVVPSASASRARAEPGLSGCCWLSCGAQPDSHTISKVARMRPSRIGETLARRYPPSAASVARLSGRRRRSISALVAPMRRRSCISASRRGIAHRQPVDIGHRQREARALQQRAHVAQVGERRNARRDAVLDLGFGGREGLAQFGQRVAADERREQQAVGLQRAANLDKRAGEIVDELQATARTRRDRAMHRRTAAPLRRPPQRAARLLRGLRSEARPRAALTAMIVPTLPLAASARRSASVGVPRSTAHSNRRSTVASRSDKSSATRSIRKVAGPSAAARARRARRSMAVEDRWDGAIAVCLRTVRTEIRRCKCRNCRSQAASITASALRCMTAPLASPPPLAGDAVAWRDAYAVARTEVGQPSRSFVLHGQIPSQTACRRATSGRIAGAVRRTLRPGGRRGAAAGSVRPAASWSTTTGLCAACWSRLSFIAPPYCERLGIPFAVRRRPGPALAGGDRRSAGLRPRARRGALRRGRTHARAGLQIRRPARPRSRSWGAGWRMPAANCSRQPKPSSRCRCTGAGNGRGVSTNRRCSPR